MSEDSNRLPIFYASENAITNAYLVWLKEDCNREDHMRWMRSQEERYITGSNKCRIKYEFKSFKGYGAELSGPVLNDLTGRIEVKAIAQDRRPTWGDPPARDEATSDIVKRRRASQVSDFPRPSPLWTLPQQTPVAASQPPKVTLKLQTGAPWGLARLSQVDQLPRDSKPLELVHKYQYKDPASLAGDRPKVDAYVLDTGIKLDHVEFNIGRARFGQNFTRPDHDTDDGDTDGHGTHVAGILGGNTFGVAKSVNIISVKVLGGMAGGSELTEAIEWVTAQAGASQNPSIINMSLTFTGRAEPALALLQDGIDLVTRRAVAQGVHVVAAAGNQNCDARDISPARVPGIMTVGASTIQDELWINPTPRADGLDKGSNYGACVGIFAPGADITSAWITSTTATELLSGTSMAAPHVAGLMAHLIETWNGPPPTPAKMINRIIADALASGKVVAGVPGGTTNLLVHM